MISFNDFAGEPALLRAEQRAAFDRVASSGWYILGPEVAAFERKWAAASKAAYVVGVGNGLDAIEIGLRALELQPGDEVITTPMTAVATVLGVVRAGAVPVLADIDPATGLLDPDSVCRCLSARTRAIMPVHLYGQLRNLERFAEIAHTSNCELVEDCAQAHGASLNGRAAGTFGAWGAFSFYPTKNLGALGDAGALNTERKDVADAALMLRNYGQSERYHHPVLGLNSRLDELQAALLSVRLGYLLTFTKRRRAIAAAYRAGIHNAAVQLPAAPIEDSAHVYHLFVIVSGKRDELQVHLAANGVQTLIHYPVPVHRQAPFADIARDPMGLRGAEQHAAECLSLPCHPQMSDDDVANVIAAVNEFS
jgi:dTDP-4-amino-4,6-dideoxygalactose transaminase